MSWTDIHVNDYGWVGKLTLVQDGVAVDISSYDTLEMIFMPPNRASAVVKTAAFDTDGTDGVVKYTVQDGDIAVAGDWKVFARISKDETELTSSFVHFSVKVREDN